MIPKTKSMLRHNLVVTFRNFLRSKGTFLINLTGLTIGLASALVIFLWIDSETSVDKFHKNDERLFQVMSNLHNSNGIVTRDPTPTGLADVLKENFTEVEYAACVTPVRWFPKFLLKTGQLNVKAEGKFVGSDFFRVFTYPFINGTTTDALADKNNIVISSSTALKLFGSTDVVGKEIAWELSNIKKNSVVSGVFEDVTKNSSDEFDIVFPLEVLQEIMNLAKDDLQSPGPNTYLVLKEGEDISSFNKKLNDFLVKRRTVTIKETFSLNPYSERYLYGNFENGIAVKGRMEYVILFAVIGITILVIACINFINLSTAKAYATLKDIGIRKTMGAERRWLITQCFTECVLLTMISLIIALLIVELTIPFLSNILQKELIVHYSPSTIFFLIGCGFFVGILAGAYPAFFISSFQPVKVLKGKVSVSSSEIFTRKTLVIFQFAISIVFIIAVVTIHRQITFIQNKSLGYNKSHVIYFEIEGEIASNLPSFIAEAKTLPGVTNASAMVGNFIGNFGASVDADINNRKIPIAVLGISYDMLETMEVPLLEGRTFKKEFNEMNRIILNQAAVDAIGLTDVIGKRIQFQGAEAEIIGVTKNFHLNSLHEAITPVVFRFDPGPLFNIFLRVDEKSPDAIAQIENLYKKFNPAFTFDYHFLEEDFKKQYSSEARLENLSLWFGAVAILLSCLGLFGLTAFTVQRRVREIGIRKVLGSTSFGIIKLLSAEFIRLVMIASMIALPLGYFLAQRWLEGFAYAIGLDLWTFAVAIAGTILLTFLIVGSLSLKALNTNPAITLKNE